MKIEDKLKDIIIAKYKSMQSFSDATEINYQTLVSIFNRGIHKASVKNIIRICQELGISADELAHNRIVPIEKDNQGKAQMTELNDILSFLRKNSDGNQFMTIDGNLMTKEEIQTVVDGMELTIEIIKKKREREN